MAFAINVIKWTQCFLNVGPALPVLASIHSSLVSTSCWRERVHIQLGEMGVSAYFTSVHIDLPSFARAVTGDAADNEKKVFAYFTSMHITVFWKGCDRQKRAQWRQRKESIYLIYKWAHTAFWQHCYTQDRNEWGRRERTDCTERTEVNQHVPTSVYRGGRHNNNTWYKIHNNLLLSYYLVNIII